MKLTRFGKDDKIVPSPEGLTTFPNRLTRAGTIVGKAADEDVWQVR